MEFSLRTIGKISTNQGQFCLRIDREYLGALQGLEGFSHIQVIWWFDGCDTAEERAKTSETKPYVHGPDQIGVFAMRSPSRPNPIALSCAEVTYIDAVNGIVGLAYIDANEGSPLLDIKPYTPSLDRVENPRVPQWCAHWPKNCETSGDFDWGSEFNF